MLNETQLLREACFIDGVWIDNANAWIDVDDPATGETIGRVPDLVPGTHRRRSTRPNA